MTELVLPATNILEGIFLFGKEYNHFGRRISSKKKFVKNTLRLAHQKTLLNQPSLLISLDYTRVSK
jgi:hypothetical protein